MFRVRWCSGRPAAEIPGGDSLVRVGGPFKVSVPSGRDLQIRSAAERGRERSDRRSLALHEKSAAKWVGGARPPDLTSSTPDFLDRGLLRISVPPFCFIPFRNFLKKLF
ncbi:hypothetical protein CDAR_95291 [Caerostris darwini]|uniref:Uncharacterized protein n=1 Tax=Caerostris darwini TaxID=1538125 RepID=A0AAV4PLL7_9ARAC|nr:hypothetical protein CDAR_95291 [Caerostris darwini]